ncbi:MAG: hypothetical protein ACTSRW_02175 [Candidatus Helarchaeota archaeon]
MIKIYQDADSKYTVEIVENIDFITKHDGEIKESVVKGQVIVKNGAVRDNIWDINISLDKTDKTDLMDEKIHILELEPQEEWTQEYKIDTEDAELLLEIDEEINVIPDTEEKSTTLVLNQKHEPHFTITIKNISSTTIKEIEIVRNIPEIFRNVKIRDDGVGKAKRKEGQIVWTIEELDPDQSTQLEFTAVITPEEKEPVNSGQIKATYSVSGGTFSSIEVNNLDGYSKNFYAVERIERDEEPNVWDCIFEFQNLSEFRVKLVDVLLYNNDYTTEEQVLDFKSQLDPEVILEPMEEWISKAWELQSEEFPMLGADVRFTVIGDVVTQTTVTVEIEAFQMPVLSLSGKKELSETQIKSYRETDITATTTINTSGKAPVDKFHIEDEIPQHFDVPDTENVKITVNGVEINPDTMTISFEPTTDIDTKRTMNIDVENVLEQVGTLGDDSTIVLSYPMKALNPVKGEEYQAGVLFQAITEDGSIVELYMESPEVEIEIIHSRRRTTDARLVQEGSSRGQYVIMIIHKNRGNSPEENKVFTELIPENFKLISAKPEPEQDGQTLKWTFNKIEPDEKVDIEFTIEGTDEYKAKHLQISYKV